MKIFKSTVNMARLIECFLLLIIAQILIFIQISLAETTDTEKSVIDNPPITPFHNETFQKSFVRIKTNGTSISKQILLETGLNLNQITEYVLNQKDKLIKDSATDDDTPKDWKDELVETCVKELDLKDVDEAVESFYTLRDIKYLPKIITDSYSISNIHSILKFLQTLIFTISDEYALGYYLFFEEMRTNYDAERSEIFQLVHYMKATFDAEKCIGIDCQIYMVYLLENIVECAPLMIWSREVHLKNIFSDEYLTADGSTQKIYTKSPKQSGNTGKWIFESLEEGRMFKMKNVDKSKYVVGGEKILKDKCSTMYLDEDQRADIWLINIVKPNIIDLKTIYDQDYLRPTYTEFNLSKGDGRTVCTWSSSNYETYSEINEWRIEVA